MESLSQGIIVRAKSIIATDGKSSHTFRAPNGEVFVMIFLGTEAAEGQRGRHLNIEATLRNMGWVRRNYWTGEGEDKNEEE